VIAVPQALSQFRCFSVNGVNLKIFYQGTTKTELQEGGAVLSLRDTCFASVDHCPAYGYGLLM